MATQLQTEKSTINRNELGVSWQQTLQSGGFLVGEEVRILVDISAVKES